MAQQPQPQAAAAAGIPHRPHGGRRGGTVGAGVLMRTLEQGDQVHFPKTGDICVINYTVYLAASSSSSSTREDPSDESSSYTPPSDQKIDDTCATLPFSFRVGSKAVIPGLDAAIHRMSVGQKCSIFIPHWYAGAATQQQHGGGGGDLVYEVHLRRIIPKEEATDRPE